MPTTSALTVSRLGNGAALHLTDESGILCNRWGTVNGVWKAPKPVLGVEANCKRCIKISTTSQEA